jgi:hypothetical protein
VDQAYDEGIETEDEFTARHTPEWLLLAAVLGQAAKDLHSRDGDLARDAARWVASQACTDVCELLGYDAERVRRFAAQKGL